MAPLPTLAAALCCALALAQVAPGVAELPSGFGQGQAQLRSAFDASSFSVSFNTVKASGNDYGNARSVTGDANVALYTLPNAGIAQGILSLDPCAVWSPHYHPRANEILFVSQGSVNISFAEENPTVVDGKTYGGRILNFTAPAQTSVIVPQGLMHVIANQNCEQATIITSFDNRDPGTVSVVRQLFNFADEVVSAATGLEALSVNLARAKVAQTALIGIDTACLQACGRPAPTAQPPASG